MSDDWKFERMQGVYSLVDTSELVYGETGHILMPSVTSPRQVHVAHPDSFPYEPLCGAEKTGDEEMHFVVDMNQVYTHPRICPDCAGHEDIPMMLLGDS